MHVLILYATVEGQTRKIATHVADRLDALGEEVELVALSGERPGDPIPSRFVRAVLCAPIHMGRYPSPFVHYLQRHAAELAAVPTAFVSVSLGVASDMEEDRRDARQVPQELLDKVGWEPDALHHAAGALKYLEYDYFKRWVMRRIARREGMPIDTSTDHEMTDWSALDGFIDAFVHEKECSD